MSDRPERIWLLHGIGEGGTDVWSDDPHPNSDDRPESTEYVRADALERAERERVAMRAVLTRASDELGLWQPEDGHDELLFGYRKAQKILNDAIEAEIEETPDD